MQKIKSIPITEKANKCPQNVHPILDEGWLVALSSCTKISKNKITYQKNLRNWNENVF